MKKYGMIFFVLSACAIAFAADDVDKEKDEVRKTIESAYINGAHAGNTDAMRAGFHEDFTMVILNDDGTTRKVTRDMWIERIEEHRAKNPDRQEHPVKHEFKIVDVMGKAAVARIEVFRDGDHIYTDFMSLYKFDDGWKIVGKIFQSHK